MSRWRLWAVLSLITLATTAIAAMIVLRDRDDAVARAQDRTSAISRLIAAHADAAIAVADRITSAAVPAVAEWDLRDPAKAQEVAALLKTLVGENGIVSSSAVIAANGTLLVTSRAYPPKPLNIANRPFMKAHTAGAADPVIKGDPEPGPISGKRRFTFSRSDRGLDGTLRAVVTAAIETSAMDILYTEAANWPGARAGLYGPGADELAQAQTPSRASPAFLGQLEAAMSTGAGSGTTTIDSDGEPRLVSWARSATHPEIYGATSQSMSEVLKEWRNRLWATGVTIILANLAIWALGYIAVRNAEASQLATMNELAIREVHHRLKNSLQLIGSLIHMRTKQKADFAWKNEVTEILNDLRAVAHVHALLQATPGSDTVDIAEAARVLCGQLAETYHAEITYTGNQRIDVAGAHATGLSIIINELVTNAVKHGGGRAEVDCHLDGKLLVIEVRNDGAKPFDQSVIGNSTKFGLRAVSAMVTGFGGEFTTDGRAPGGAALAIRIPLANLSK